METSTELIPMNGRLSEEAFAIEPGRVCFHDLIPTSLLTAIRGWKKF